jgi:hypothetical protein
MLMADQKIGSTLLMASLPRTSIEMIARSPARQHDRPSGDGAAEEMGTNRSVTSTVPPQRLDWSDAHSRARRYLCRTSRTFQRSGRDLAELGQIHVVGEGRLAKPQQPNGWRNCNLPTTFEKLVERAGVEPWPRLFHILPSLRETELLESFLVHSKAPRQSIGGIHGQ